MRGFVRAPPPAKAPATINAKLLKTTIACPHFRYEQVTSAIKGQSERKTQSIKYWVFGPARYDLI
jgi:hypothetical protein